MVRNDGAAGVILIFQTFFRYPCVEGEGLNEESGEDNVLALRRFRQNEIRERHHDGADEKRHAEEHQTSWQHEEGDEGGKNLMKIKILLKKNFKLR